MKKRAFTLAEVLLTMGIIGVVAAMTIPSLVNNYHKDVYVTSIKKFYSELDQALQRQMIDMNADNLTQAGINSQADVNNFVENYLKYTRVCANTTTNCFPPRDSYRKIDGTPLNASLFGDTQSYVLASGASIRPMYRAQGSKKINFVVDTNGDKKPNVQGRDLFTLGVYNNGEIDDFDDDNVNNTPPLTDAQRNRIFDLRCNGGTGNLWGCFGKLLNDNWKMDY